MDSFVARQSVVLEVIFSFLLPANEGEGLILGHHRELMSFINLNRTISNAFDSNDSFWLWYMHFVFNCAVCTTDGIRLKKLTTNMVVERAEKFCFWKRECQIQFTNRRLRRLWNVQFVNRVLTCRHVAIDWVSDRINLHEKYEPSAVKNHTCASEPPHSPSSFRSVSLAGLLYNKVRTSVVKIKKKLLRFRRAPQSRSNNLNTSIKSNSNKNLNTNINIDANSCTNTNTNSTANTNTNNSESCDLIPHRFIDKCKVVPEMVPATCYSSADSYEIQNENGDTTNRNETNKYNLYLENENTIYQNNINHPRFKKDENRMKEVIISEDIIISLLDKFLIAELAVLQGKKCPPQHCHIGFPAESISVIKFNEWERVRITKFQKVEKVSNFQSPSRFLANKIKARREKDLFSLIIEMRSTVEGRKLETCQKDTYEIDKTKKVKKFFEKKEMAIKKSKQNFYLFDGDKNSNCRQEINGANDAELYASQMKFFPLNRNITYSELNKREGDDTADSVKVNIVDEVRTDSRVLDRIDLMKDSSKCSSKKDYRVVKIQVKKTVEKDKNSSGNKSSHELTDKNVISNKHPNSNEEQDNDNSNDDDVDDYDVLWYTLTVRSTELGPINSDTNEMSYNIIADRFKEVLVAVKLFPGPTTRDSMKLAARVSGLSMNPFSYPLDEDAYSPTWRSLQCNSLEGQRIQSPWKGVVISPYDKEVIPNKRKNII